MASSKHLKRKSKSTEGFARVLVYFISHLVILFLWEIVMYFQTDGVGFSIWTVLFLPSEAMFLTFLSGWFKNKKTAAAVDIILLIPVTAYYISQLIYHNIFGSFYSISMMGMGADAVGNFGWGMGSAVTASIGALIIILLPVAAWIFVRARVIRRSIKYSGKLHAAVAVLTLVLWFFTVMLLPLGGKEQFSAYNAYHGDLVDTDTASAKIGVLANSIVETAKMFGNAFSDNGGSDELEPKKLKPVDTEPVVNTEPNIIAEFDFAKLAESTKNADIRSVCEYAAAATGTNKNEYTGMFKGYNLIYMCAESFSNYALDPVITPTLYKLANEGIVLDNYYNSFKNTTTNGEFAMLTSLWPDVSRYAKMGNDKGSFVQSAKNLMPMGLGTLFSEQCKITARGYHNYNGSYYSRDKSLPNLGFECKFMNAGMKFTTSWPSSDLEMFEQSVDDYINDEQFCSYYMTFSGHGPYSDSNVMYNRNIKEVKKLASGRDYNTCAFGYFATNYELEKAVKYLLERLENAGKLENTVIVLAGDHYPYYLEDTARNKIAGHKVDTDFEMYKSNCIIYNGGIEKPIHVDTCCCNVDILPTILNLFDIKYDSRLMAGNDIFSGATHVAMLYNKSFVTEKVRYNSTNGKAIWADGVTFTDEEKEGYLKTLNDYVSAKYLLSLKIVDTDFYNFAWTQSGLLTEAPKHQ